MSIIACSVDECERKFYGRGFCQMHYNRWRKHGTTDAHIQPERTTKECSVERCAKRAMPLGVCTMHRRRLLKHGSYDPQPRALLKDTLCTIDGCEKPHSATRLCKTHYSRLKKTGSPTTRKLGAIVDGKRVCSRCKVDTPMDLMSRTAVSYCRECINAAARAKNVHKPKIVLGIKSCGHCGEDFAYNKKRNLHCSRACAEATVNKRNWKHLQNRRARMKAAFVESFHASEIFERDRWICGICELPIDPIAKLPDQMSGSIDHIIPISRGGTHERANVQAAHLFCNVSKGAKVA